MRHSQVMRSLSLSLILVSQPFVDFITVTSSVALAALYLGKRVHNQMVITGMATINGDLGAVSRLKEKAMGALGRFPEGTVNMIIPHANTVDERAIWSTFHTITQEGTHRPVFRREWMALPDKKDRDRLKVFAAKNLYEVLGLALVSPTPGENECGQR